jgi:hypothetical protein
MPVDKDAGITDVQTAECNVVMYTKPDKAKGILVWKVHGFSKQWAGITGTDVERCSASLR